MYIGLLFWEDLVALKKARVCVFVRSDSLLGAGVLGDGLGALRYSVLGQFSWQQKTDSSLDLSGGDGAPPVVVSQPGSLSSNALKDVIHEGVHDGHGLGTDTSVRVDLLQDFVDVDGVRLPPPPLLLLLTRPGGLSLAGGFLCSLGCWFWRHVDCSVQRGAMGNFCVFGLLY